MSEPTTTTASWFASRANGASPRPPTGASRSHSFANGRTFDSIGAYRGHADFPLTVWHDGFVRTTSFAAAAASLP